MKKLVEVVYEHVFMHNVCASHNVERYADTELARQELIHYLLDHGVPGWHIEEAFDAVSEVYKVSPPELRIERYL